VHLDPPVIYGLILAVQLIILWGPRGLKTSARIRRIVLIFILAFVLPWIDSRLFGPKVSSKALAADLPRPPFSYVLNEGVISPEAEARLSELLRKSEQRTHHQFVVALFQSLGNRSLEAYSNRLFKGWGIGRARENDGLLLCVFQKDRRWRVEVGYGLEPVLPDALAFELMDAYAVPFFKVGDFDQGVLTAAAALAEKIGAPQSLSAVALPRKALPTREELARGGGLLYDEGVLEPAQFEWIKKRLEKVRAAHGREFVVALFKDTEGEPPKSIAARQFSDWKVGGESGDGALLTVFMQQRTFRLQIGPAARHVLEPRVAEGQLSWNGPAVYGDRLLYETLRTDVDWTSQQLELPWPPPPPPPAKPSPPVPFWQTTYGEAVPIVAMIFVGSFFFLILISLLAGFAQWRMDIHGHRRRKPYSAYVSTALSDYLGFIKNFRGGSGGTWGGAGGGGFSGGGGSSGGGGASGGW
jgi:uncharacterized membrane protein YgcG